MEPTRIAARVLAEVLSAEVDERVERRRQRRIKEARFTTHQTTRRPLGEPARPVLLASAGVPDGRERCALATKRRPAVTVAGRRWARVTGYGRCVARGLKVTRLARRPGGRR